MSPGLLDAAVSIEASEDDPAFAALGASDASADATLVSAAMDGLALTWLAHPDDRAFERRARAAVRRMVERIFG